MTPAPRMPPCFSQGAFSLGKMIIPWLSSRTFPPAFRCSLYLPHHSFCSLNRSSCPVAMANARGKTWTLNAGDLPTLVKMNLIGGTTILVGLNPRSLVGLHCIQLALHDTRLPVGCFCLFESGAGERMRCLVRYCSRPTPTRMSPEQSKECPERQSDSDRFLGLARACPKLLAKQVQATVTVERVNPSLEMPPIFGRVTISKFTSRNMGLSGDLAHSCGLGDNRGSAAALDDAAAQFREGMGARKLRRVRRPRCRAPAARSWRSR
jgi:hypothetical protein